MTKGKGSEQEVMNAIIQYLEYSGVYCVRINSGAIKIKEYFVKLGKRGTPDLLVCLDGYFVGLEVKKDASAARSWLRKVGLFIKTSFPNPNSLREIDQHKAMELIRRSGGSGFLVSSVDEVEEIIKKRRADLNYRDNYLSTV